MGERQYLALCVVMDAVVDGSVEDEALEDLGQDRPARYINELASSSFPAYACHGIVAR